MICWHDWVPFRAAKHSGGYFPYAYYRPSDLPGDDKLKEMMTELKIYGSELRLGKISRDWFEAREHKWQDSICTKCDALRLNLDKKIKAALKKRAKECEYNQKAKVSKEKAFKYLDLKSKADE